MQPDNPIVGGIVLRIPAIRSPDYVAGVSGWTINVDGTAEFNNVTVRGTFVTGTVPGAHVAITGGQILVFDSGNNLIGQIDSTGIAALGTDGSIVHIYDVAGIARLGLLPGGGNVNEASVIAGMSGPQPQLVIRSPQQTLTLPNTQSLILLTGATSTVPGSAVITSDNISLSGTKGVSLSGQNASLNVGDTGSGPGQAVLSAGSVAIALDGGGLSITNNITLSTATGGSYDLIANAVRYNFVEQPMGLCAHTDSSANSAAVGAETVVMTLTKPTIKTGRAYEFIIRQTLAATATTIATTRVRENSAVGAVISDRFTHVDGNFQSMILDVGKIKNVTGTDDNTKDAVLTLQSAAGTVQQVQSTTRWRSFELWDIGAASDFPNATPW